MDWLEKRKEELKKRQEKQKAVNKNKGIILKSRIWERIEKIKLDIERETLYKFDIGRLEFGKVSCSGFNYGDGFKIG
ncbi:MAG: hypothetical protein V1877_00070 [Candidatus Tagabacteria bacterium]